MDFEPRYIHQIVSTVWEAILGLPVDEAPDAPPTADPIAAMVTIAGPWSGAVLLECPPQTARVAASVMFATDPAAVTETDCRDAVAELANMVGGNVKGLLPEGCRLSLPTPVPSPAAATLPKLPAHRVAHRATFACLGEILAVTVLEKSEGHATAAA